MKKNKSYKYKSVSSFEDIRREKQILLLRDKIMDARISLDFLELKSSLSPSKLISSFAKEYILPEVAALLFNIADRKKD